MDMTPARWNATTEYLDELFGQDDEAMATLMERAIAAGIPDIAISASVGRFLLLLARLTGARTIVEVGTLAGYSGTWLARGLAHTPDKPGQLITIEPVPLHADFAQQHFETVGLAGRIDIRRSTGLEELPKLMSELGAGSVDLVFLDAIKTEYPDYLPHAKKLLRPGGLLVADNALGSGDWWIDQDPAANESHAAADRFNRLVAADSDFDASCLPIREGVMVARKK